MTFYVIMALLKHNEEVNKMSEKKHKIMNAAMKLTNQMVPVSLGNKYYQEHERVLRLNIIKVTVEMCAEYAEHALKSGCKNVKENIMAEMLD